MWFGLGSTNKEEKSLVEKIGDMPTFAKLMIVALLILLVAVATYGVLAVWFG